MQAETVQAAVEKVLHNTFATNGTWYTEPIGDESKEIAFVADGTGSVLAFWHDANTDQEQTIQLRVRVELVSK